MWLQLTKTHNSIKTVDGVMILNLCTSSDNALYLYLFSSFKKISLRVSKLLSGCNLYIEICKGA